MANEQNTSARFKPADMSVDSSKHIALYIQLANIFRYKIKSNAWAAGYQLPNFETLAVQFKVGRITVRQAVSLLVQEQLLTSSRGRGTFVRDSSDALTATARASLDAMRPEADDQQIRILFKGETDTLPAEFSGSGTSYDCYTEITKVHLHRGQPFGMMRIFVATEIFKRFPKRAIEKHKLLSLVMKHDKISDMLEQTMTVEPADFILSEHLHYSLGSPVAKILRRLVDKDGRVAYAGLSWYRGDTFVMNMVLPKSSVQEMPPSVFAPSSRNAK
ncbi:MAG: GntR family transcriptional regulator [Pseudomonadota bacterium]